MGSGTTANNVNGENGVDTISYQNYTAGVTVSLAEINAQTVTTGDVDTIANFENLLGGSGADNLTGSNANNSIFAQGGNDTIFASAGSDILDGGANDTDILKYNTLGAAIEVNMGSTNLVTKAASQIDTVSNFEEIWGSDYADKMNGADAADTFRAGLGNDTLSGAAGTDSLYGEDGDDTLSGGVS